MSQLPPGSLSLSFASLETQRRALHLQRLLAESRALQQSCSQSTLDFHLERTRFYDSLRDAYASLRQVNVLLGRANGWPPSHGPAK